MAAASSFTSSHASFTHPHPHPQPQSHQPQPGNPASKDPAQNCLSISAAGAVSLRAAGGFLSLSISGSLSFNSTKSRRTGEAPVRRLRAVYATSEPSLDFESAVLDEYLLRSGRDMTSTFKSTSHMDLLGLNCPQEIIYGVVVHGNPLQHMQSVVFDFTQALGVDFMVDDCSTTTRSDYTLTEQDLVAVDKKTPINQDLLSNYLPDPVHGDINACAWVRPKGGIPLIADTGFVRADI